MSPSLPAACSPLAFAFALALVTAGPVAAQQHDHGVHSPAPIPAQSDPRTNASHDAPAQAGKPAVHATHAVPAAQDHAHHAQAGPPQAAAPGQPREPIPAPTAADFAAAFPVLYPHAMEHAPSTHFLAMFDRLEGWDADSGTGQAWEASVWIGSDLSRLWLRSEGERLDGRTRGADLEVLYGRSISPWWDVVAGVRQDFPGAHGRSWAAFGVQGLAPYKFDVSATAYLGASGQVAARVEAEYELLLTNRLILQPRLEAGFSARDEPAYGNGSGLNRLEAGLRLRYEITRRFAPYVGMVHERLFGDTADYHRAAGDAGRDTRVVVGVRLWF